MSEPIIIALLSVFGSSIVGGIGWLIKTIYTNRKRDADAESARVAWQEGIARDLEALKKDFRYQKDRVAKIEMLQLLQHEPPGSRLVKEKYEKYHNAGFNSYIEDLYTEWKALG
ncbi:MAG: hypothetical protein LBU48_03270 [Coriobacteriales bacterium]|nr:hypothetical protein [Coriobacteriales bacterium]